MNCFNDNDGCYHDKAVHFEGNGRCLVKGCICKKFTKRESKLS